MGMIIFIHCECIVWPEHLHTVAVITEQLFMRAYVDEFMAEWDGKDADYEVKEHFDRG